MKKRWLRLISIVCSLAITAQCLPVVALDNDAEALPVPPGPVAEEQKDIAGEAAIQWEETELRERNVKHFRLEGGLMLAAFFMVTDYTTKPVTPWGEVLFAAGVLALSEQSRNVLAIAISAALVVFSYTLCKSLGVLKNQKK